MRRQQQSDASGYGHTSNGDSPMFRGCGYAGGGGSASRGSGYADDGDDPVPMYRNYAGSNDGARQKTWRYATNSRTPFLVRRDDLQYFRYGYTLPPYTEVWRLRFYEYRICRTESRCTAAAENIIEQSGTGEAMFGRIISGCRGKYPPVSERHIITAPKVVGARPSEAKRRRTYLTRRATSCRQGEYHDTLPTVRTGGYSAGSAGFAAGLRRR